MSKDFNLTKLNMQIHEPVGGGGYFYKNIKKYKVNFFFFTIIVVVKHVHLCYIILL